MAKDRTIQILRNSTPAATREEAVAALEAAAADCNDGELIVARYDENKFEYVDLGLPSGLKWAKCNLGADAETGLGDYFAFGETTPRAAGWETDAPYDWAHAPFNNGSSSYNSSYFTAHKSEWFNGDVLKPEYDAATVNMGSGWRMPTMTDFEELLSDTNNEWVENYKGTDINGYKFVNKSDSSKYIFIPASGFRYDSSVDNVGSDGYVWSSSLTSSLLRNAWSLYFDSGNINVDDNYRSVGYSVRGVVPNSSNFIKTIFGVVYKNGSNTSVSIFDNVEEIQNEINSRIANIERTGNVFPVIDIVDTLPSGMVAGDRYLYNNNGTYMIAVAQQDGTVLLTHLGLRSVRVVAENMDEYCIIGGVLTNLTSDLNDAIERANEASDTVEGQIAQVQHLKTDVETYIGSGLEQIVVTVTSSVQGVSVSGLTLNVYINSLTTPVQYTTDSNGQCAFKVNNGYRYRIVFPEITGCEPLPDVTHTASIAQRSVEVEYIPKIEHFERLDVHFILTETHTPYTQGAVVNITYDGITTTYTSDSTGVATANIPIGKNYRVTLVSPQDLYIWNGKTIYDFTAEKALRTIVCNLYTMKTGVFIVTDDGEEYSLAEWQNSERRSHPEDAKAIKVSSTPLINNSGVFGIDIDALANRSYLSKQWSASNVWFDSIPHNGNSSSQPYYYCGLEATRKVIDEGDSRTIETPAADEAYSHTITTGGIEHQGYLGSTGQWLILWENRATVDAILDEVRSGHAYNLSSYTTYKWTITQSTEAYSYNFASVVNSNPKGSSYAVVPFYEY